MTRECSGCHVKDGEILRLAALAAEASGAAERYEQLASRNQRDTAYWRTRADGLGVELGAAKREVKRLSEEKDVLGQAFEREKRTREAADAAVATLRERIVQHAPEALTWQPIRDAMGLGEA